MKKSRFTDAGAFDRGWLPANIPPSARDLREYHDIDTNETWGSFSFNEQDEEVFRASLAAAAPEDGRCGRDPRVPWWEEQRVSQLERYRLAEERGAVYFGVDWTNRTAFFWRCAR